jgi:RecA/RadA recombinase
MSISFLTKFNNAVEKIEGVNTSSAPPAYWFSSGNYVLNKILSGSFYRAFPQGRVTALCGLSGVGKSFLAGNITKAAQADGAFVLVLDSENALDDMYMGTIGVNLDPSEYSYTDPTTIVQAVGIISAFTKGYRAAYGDTTTNPDAPKVVIVVDSLDMLMTESELKNYQKGDTAGDQGQQAKQLKSFLKTVTQDIKNLNITLIVTKQVYKAQGMFQTEPYIITEAVKYSASQIVLLNKLKLRSEEDVKEVSGIRMQVEVYKTRFTKPFQKVTINVPYDTGMDPYSGLFEVAEALGVITSPSKGYYCVGTDTTKLRKADIEQSMYPRVLELCEATDTFIAVSDERDEIADEGEDTVKAKKIAKSKELLVED